MKASKGIALRGVATLGLLAIASCGQSDEDDAVVTQRSALTNAQAILSFETPGRWTAAQGTLGSSNQASDGGHSLSFTTSGWIEIQSARLSSTEVSPTSQLGVDILLPLSQPNPSWFGQVLLYIDCPSRGIHHQFADQKDLSRLRLGAFDTVQFNVPSATIQLLGGAPFADLSISLGFSVPSSATYLVDNVRFSPRPLGSDPQLAQTVNADILGFEREGNWTVSQGGHEQSTVHSQGAASISVHDFTWTELRSARLSSLGAVGSSIHLDVMLPSNGANARSNGAANLYVDLPSQGLQGVHLGHQTFSALPLGAFGTLTFPVASSVAVKLAAQYSDLVFRIAVSVPSGTSAIRLDNLRTIDLIPKLEGIVNHPLIGYSAVFSYTSSATGSVPVPVGINNAFFPAPLGRGQPTIFQSNGGAFAVRFDGNPLTWQLFGRSTIPARSNSNPLPTEPTADGTSAILPDGRRVLILTDLDKVLSNTVVSADNTGGVTPGKTDGALQVTGDGAATYDVPLWTPEGRAGIGPQLSLRYHSRSGDGPLGVGWNIAGLSQIARCHRTLATDTVVTPVKFVNTDALCLDGQRMVFATNAGSSEYRTINDTFKRIVPHGAGPDGPDYFEVFLRDGRILTYGGPGSRIQGLQVRVTANRSDASDPAIDYPKTVRFAWSLSEVRDRFGNSMTFEYALDTETEGQGNGVEQRITAIRYTAGTGNVPRRSVAFAYEPRPDPGEAYIGGLKVVRRQRLREISMSGPNPRTPAVLRRYKLVYRTDTSSRRSLLSSVQECLASEVCKPPTTFSWTPGGSRFYAAPVVHANGSGANPAEPFMNVGDFNGDGLDDISYSYGAAAHPFTVMRFSGAGTLSQERLIDSRAPVVALPPNPDGSRTLLVARDETHDYPSPPSLTRRFWRYAQLLADGQVRLVDDLDGDGILSGNTELAEWEGLSSLVSAPKPIFAADLHGDGLAEIIRTVEYSNIPNPLWAGRAGRWPGFFTPYFRFITGPAPQVVNYPADLDGDGQIEFLTFDALAPAPSERYAGLNLSENGEFDYRLTSLPIARDRSGGRTYEFGDINGDGLADAFAIPFDGGFPSVYINSGVGFLPPVHFQVSLPGDPGRIASRAPDNLSDPVYFNTLTDQGVRLGDWDGDGRVDIFLLGDRDHRRPRQAGGSSVWVYRTNGRLPPELIDTGAPAGERVRISDGVTVGYAWSHLIDAHGTGAADIVNAASASGSAVQMASQVATKPDLLVGVQDGLGARAILDYRPISDPTVYAPGPHAPEVAWPNALERRGIWVVASHGSDIGNDFVAGSTPTFRTITHSYEGAQTDSVTREWLGFARHIEYDPAAFRTTTRSYHTDRDRRFLMHAERTVVNFPGPAPGPIPQHIFNKTFQWEKIVSQPQTHGYIGLRQAYEDTIRLDDASRPESAQIIRQITTTYTRDAFDNPTVIEAVDGHIVIRNRVLVSNTFVNDTTNWLIGFKTREEVTSSGLGFAPEVRIRTFDPEPGTVLVRTTTIEPDGGPAEFLATTVDRDPATGLARSQTQTDRTGLSRTTAIAYQDVDGVYPSSLTNPMGHVMIAAVHPGLGVIGRKTSPNGVADSWQYDGFGRMKVYLPAGDERRDVTYLPAGNPTVGGARITTAHAGGRQETVAFDRLGRPRSTQFPGPTGQIFTSAQTYDELGRVSTTSKAFPANSDRDTYGYDDLGRVLNVTHADGSFSRWVYDDQSITQIDEMGVFRRVDLDSLDRPSQVTERAPGGADVITKHTYGAFGNMRTVTDAADNVTTFDYDVRGRLRATTERDRGRRETVYNAFDDAITIIDPMTVVQRYYDNLGRLDREEDSNGLRAFTWDTTPHGIGMLARAASPDATVELRYDSLGRDQESLWTVGGTTFGFQQGYDQFGRPSELRYPEVAGRDRFAIKHVYSPFGYKQAVIDGRPNRTSDFWRLVDADPGTGQIVETFAGNVSFTTRLSADRGFPQTQVATGPSGTTLHSQGYSFFSNGTLKQRVNSLDNTVEDFTYDSMNRLATWSTNGRGNYTFQYDVLGNLLSRTGQGASVPLPNLTNQYDQTNGVGPHAITSSTFGTYGYDGKGNQTDGPDRHVAYASFDLPIEVQRGGATVRLGYDAFKKRVVKDDAATRVVTLLGLYESRTTASGTTHIFFVPGAEGLAAQVTFGLGSSEETLAMIHDHIGSPTALVRSNGSPAERFKFEPFGGRIDPLTFAPIGHSTGLTPESFGGHRADAELALLDMGGRIYDQSVGRFLTPDPFIPGVLASQSLNSYSYVRNNPTTLVDPTGLLDSGTQLVGIHPINGDIGSLVMTTLTPTTVEVTFDPSLVGTFYDPFVTDWTLSDRLGGTPFGPTTPSVPPRLPSATGSRVILANAGTLAPPITIPGNPPGVQAPPGLLGKTLSKLGTAGAAATILWRLFKQGRGDNFPSRDGIPIMIYSKTVTPQIGRHIEDAIAEKPWRFLLHRGSPAGTDARRRLALRGYPSAGTDPATGQLMQWDEYPFASSAEGGTDVSVRAVPAVENLVQSMIIKTFYMHHKMKVGDPFIVQVIP